ncbi:MAG: type II toxin-antitoxin system antitoxin SocA domain-containing protein, partial [Pyrobaculum sp.]
METIGKYDVGDVVAYVAFRLGNVGSLKKLMKLLFLIQYETRRLFTPRAVKFLYRSAPVTRAEFFIW